MRKPVVIFAALMVGAVILAGCTVTTATIKDVKLGTAVDSETSMVTDEVKSYTTTAPEFNASVEIANAPEDTVFLGEWFYDGEAITEPTELTAEGSRYLVFTLTNDDIWPEGDYEFKVSIQDTDKATIVPFTVTAE